jgi:superfamily II DNA or RNA helicase
MKLTFDKGTIQIQGDVRVPNSNWDEPTKTFRTMALYNRDIIDFLKRSGFDFEDEVLNLLPRPELQSSVVCRDYQSQALDAWTANGNRGMQN